jgi:hypothetical protein
MTNVYSFWLNIYLYALQCADENAPVFYFSRIDGALLPQVRDLD